MTATRPADAARWLRDIVIDVGRTHVKVLATRPRTPRRIPSRLSTARQMVSAVQQLTADWRYNVVSIGYPGFVIHGRLDPLTGAIHYTERGWGHQGPDSLEPSCGSRICHQKGFGR